MLTQENTVFSWENVNQVTKADDKKILVKVSGFAKSGKLLGIMGPSGAGKSALLNVLGGYQSTEFSIDSKIQINGNEINHTDISKYVCYSTQETPIFDKLTVLETLEFEARIEGNNGLNFNPTLYSLGLKDVMHNRVSEISAGEGCRVNIALSMYSRNQILIFDEPLSTLDSFQAKFVLNMLKVKIEEGKIVIISIHQPSLELLNIIDDFYIVADGRFVYHGPITNMEDHFMSAGVKLVFDKGDGDKNVCDAVIDSISEKDDNSKIPSRNIKKLYSLQKSLFGKEKRGCIHSKQLPKVLKSKHLSWLIYYLYVVMFRRIIEMFSIKKCIFLWIPLSVFMSIDLFRDTLREKVFNQYKIIDKAFSYLCEHLSILDLAFRQIIEDMKNGDQLQVLWSLDLEFKSDTPNLPIEINCFVFFIEFVFSYSYIFIMLKCLALYPLFPSAHKNIFKVLSHNVRNGKFTWFDCYVSLLCILSPLLCILGILHDFWFWNSTLLLFPQQIPLMIIKYVFYYLAISPLYFLLFSYYSVWFEIEMKQNLVGKKNFYFLCCILNFFISYELIPVVYYVCTKKSIHFSLLSFLAWCSCHYGPWYCLGLKDLGFYVSLSLLLFIVRFIGVYSLIFIINP